jgi:hypothetical protein
LAGGFALIAGAAERNQRSINGLASGLQRTRSDYVGAATEINAAARQLAETASLGTQESRAAPGQLASVPCFRVTRDNLVDMGKAAHDVGAIFREDVAGARSVSPGRWRKRELRFAATPKPAERASAASTPLSSGTLNFLSYPASAARLPHRS